MTPTPFPLRQEVFGNGAECPLPGEIRREGEISEERCRDPSVVISSRGHHNGGGKATSKTGAKDTGVAPYHSIGGLRQADASESSSIRSSHSKPREIGEGGDGAQPFLDGYREEGSRRGGDQLQQPEKPPWLTPGCARSTKPWRTLLGVPWPAGISPDFSTVFSHQWAENTEKSALWRTGGGGLVNSPTMATAVAAAATVQPQAVASIPWSVEMSSGRSSPAPKPGALLRTILRLVAGEP